MTERIDMDVNAPQLRKTLDWAYEQHLAAQRDEPSEWDQRRWIQETPVTACGTVCCIAGKVALELGWQPMASFIGSGEVRRDGVDDFAADVAERELGLSSDQAEYLFASSNTIERLYFLAGEFTNGEITAPPGLDMSRADWSRRCPCGCDEVQF